MVGLLLLVYSLIGAWALDGRLADRQNAIEDRRVRAQEVADDVRFVREVATSNSRTKPFAGLRLEGAQLSSLDLSCGARSKPADVDPVSGPGPIAAGCANFDGANLRSAQLYRVGLRGASFVLADLNSAQISFSDLRYVDFDDADVRQAALAYADLRGAQLDANFEGADLGRADMRGAQFGVANFRATDLQGAILSRADLSDVDLARADLTDAILRRANLPAGLDGVDLQYAKMNFATATGTSFRCALMGSADLRGADLRNADLSGADLSGANLKGADLTGANLSGTIVMGVDLTVATTSTVNASEAITSSKDLSVARAEGCEYPDSVLTR